MASSVPGDERIAMQEAPTENELRSSLKGILECAVCLGLICEPISISCGHSFCRSCLVQSLKRDKKKCPSCRAICHVAAETVEENIMLKSLSMALNPIEYALRQEENARERALWSSTFPIFFYNDVLLPGSNLSLHLFEPRYRTMMQRVVNSTRSFAYVANFGNYTANISDIALIASITDCEFMPDGRCMIEATLGPRHIILDHFEEAGTQGLHFCRVQPLVDEPLDASTTAQAAVLRDQAMQIVSRMFLNDGYRDNLVSKYGPAPHDLEQLSLWLIAFCPRSVNGTSRLKLMKTKDTLQRLMDVLRIIQQPQAPAPQPRSGRGAGLFRQGNDPQAAEAFMEALAATFMGGPGAASGAPIFGGGIVRPSPAFAGVGRRSGNSRTTSATRAEATAAAEDGDSDGMPPLIAASDSDTESDEEPPLLPQAGRGGHDHRVEPGNVNEDEDEDYEDWDDDEEEDDDDDGRPRTFRLTPGHLQAMLEGFQNVVAQHSNHHHEEEGHEDEDGDYEEIE